MISRILDNIVEINELLNEIKDLDFENIPNEDLIVVHKALNKLNQKTNGLINIINSEIA